ncbi:MAG: hypothetical protein KAQ92_08945 [Candidatus Aenigmarchaeota archaeon]|nr:hypothetical protein [Candidatus Aenigmarchaeota archaeon]
MALLYIWVEGNDDVRFFEKIIKPIFEKKYDSIKIIKCAGKTKEHTNNYIKSIESMKDDYIFVRDINSSPCVTIKKEKTQKIFKKVDKNKIIVVVREIESWYLAGISDENLKKFKMNNPPFASLTPQQAAGYQNTQK